jgi:hypothetical protein
MTPTTPLAPPAAEGWDEANGYLGIAIGVLITVILVLITIILTILYKNLQQGRHGAPKRGQNNSEVSMLNISQHRREIKHSEKKTGDQSNLHHAQGPLFLVCYCSK